jgi:hypothetical protein
MRRKVRFEGEDPIKYSSLRLVENICGALAAPSRSHRNCLGFVLDEDLKFWSSHPVDGQTCVKIEKSCPSLEDLLSNTSPYHPTGLNNEECHCLAVNLASSLLQLHGTPWIGETWCIKRIYFSRPVNVEQPYVMINFTNSSRCHDTQASFGPNPYLVALGIILLELSEKRSFLEWIKSRPDINLTDSCVLKAVSLLFVHTSSDKPKAGG